MVCRYQLQPLEINTADRVTPPSNLSHRWAQEQSSADAAWSERLEEAHHRWLRERGELERAAAERLEAAHGAAAARYDALRSHLEGRLAAIGERLAALAAKEGRKEASCRELKREAEALRAAAEEECGRRRGAERTLHEAATLFRRELSDKAAEMQRLQGQVRRMRRLSGQPAVVGGAGVGSMVVGGLAAGSPIPLYGAAASLPPAAAAAPRTAVGFDAAETTAGRCSTSPGHLGSCSPGIAAAADLGHELAALRAARNDYATAVLEQDWVRNSLLSSLGDTLGTVGRRVQGCAHCVAL